jgi:S1-C subfamily serine protease
MHARLFVLRIVVAVAIVTVSAVLAAQTTLRSIPLPTLGASPAVVITPVNLADVLAPRPRVAWQPRTNAERQRGGVDVYAAAAPAVVVVRTSDGHGSGFFVSADGLLVTNHHVIKSGLTHSRDESAAVAHTGQIGAGGIMELRPQSFRAVLYKVDPIRDLALLKIQPTAGQTAKLPFIRLGATAPRPGLDCAIVGHPSSGMLWTYRPCQVASVGAWPKDLVNLVMPRLAATGATRQSAEEFVGSQSGHRIILTSAQANPGDSGGPVLDAMGGLIGVTFAGPGNREEDKFTYHVHVDEVRSFLANVPDRPLLLVPDPWDLPPRLMLRDVDGDGVADVLMAGSDDRPEVLLFDLDGDSPRAPSARELGALARARKWDFEVAVDVRGSGYTSYYDVDNDGSYDRVLVTDTDSMDAKGEFALGPANRWAYQVVKNRMILDPGLLRTASHGQRLVTTLQRLGLKLR